MYAVIQKHLDSIVSDTAFFGDKEVSDVNAALNKGYSLVQASGMSASDLLNDLVGSLNQDLQVTAASSGMSADELAKAKYDAAATINGIISQPGYNPFKSNPASDLKRVIAKRMSRIIQDAATVADAEYSDIIARLESGQNLISATGVSAKDLTDALVDMVNQDIDRAAANGSSAQAAAEAKQDARNQIRQLITVNGLTATDNVVNPQAVIDHRLANLAEDVAFVADLDKTTILDAVAKGKTLMQASGMSPSDLVNRLTEFVSQDLDSAASGKNVPADKLLQWKNDAKRQITQKLNS